MATKETVKHSIFRQYDSDDVIEIALTDSDGDEIAVVPGNRSESDIKLLAQQNGHYGPVNLLARLSNGTTNGPVQISVPTPKTSASSLFKKSKLSKFASFEAPTPEGAAVAAAARRSAEERNQNDVERSSLAFDSIKRLDRIATDSVTTERARVDHERAFWQEKLEEERELAREREEELARKVEEERIRAREREEELEARFEDQMMMLKESQDNLLRETRNTMNSKLTAITDAHDRTLREYRSAEESKIKHFASDSDEKISLVREMSEQSTRILESSSAQTIATLKTQLEVMTSRIKDLENIRERENEAARTRYEDFRDRMTDDLNRVREEKAKAEQSRLEMMLLSQKATSEDIRREVDRVTGRYEADIKELKTRYETDIKDAKRSYDDELRERNRTIENLENKYNTANDKFREESTRAEMAMLREQANREPLKAERLMPLLSALPMEQRANLVSRAIASDLDLDLDDDKEEEKKPSLMDSIGSALTMMAANGMGRAQQQQSQPQPQPQPRPAPRPAPQQQQKQQQQQAPRPAQPAPVQAAPAQSSAFGATEEV